ncbi:hypothetical protein L7F22_055379 [Adiantum nelumboides]|nr:hypothetical protein [Adiantum nelumboides]
MSTWNKHYHWKTKNATPWTKEYFRKKLVGASSSSVQIDSLTNFEGDVELGNRKGKLITIYDCSFTLEWSGKTASGDDVKGQVQFPEVSHEVADEEREYPFEASLTSKASDESRKLCDVVRKELVPGLLPHFHAFRAELIAENAKDVGHEDSPANGSSSASSGTSTPAAGTGAPSAAAAASSSSSSTTAAASASKTAAAKSVSTTKVDVSTDLSIRREDLWGLLTEPGRIPMWTRAPAQVGYSSL